MGLNTQLRGDQIKDTSISGAHIIDGVVTESKLDVYNAPTDGYVLKWNSAQSKLEWETLAGMLCNEVPIGLVNGSNTTYILANTPVTDSLVVFLNGLMQEPGGGNDYTLASDTVTFTTAPETDDIILANYLTASGLAGSSASSRSYVKVSDVKSAGTDGGTFTSGAWRTRTLNTEDNDPDGICSLSNSQITLDAGTYECSISCPGFRVENHKAKLINATDDADIIMGTAEYSYNTASRAQTKSIVSGRFTIASNKALEVRHYCFTTYARGFGTAGNLDGSDEVYTIAEFWKVG